MSDVSLADQLAAMQEQMAALLASAGTSEETDEVTAKILANAPGKRTSRGKATQAKSNEVKRNMQPRLVTPDGKARDYTPGAAMPDGVVFLVMPESASKTSNVVFRNGSRCKPFIDGSPVRGSWPRVAVAAAAGIADELDTAHELVDSRALLGSHKPAAAA